MVLLLFITISCKKCPTIKAVYFAVALNTAVQPREDRGMHVWIGMRRLVCNVTPY
ncbi:hypothetical protein BRADI_1g29106v3 [Brachypodium distachyon]|uniref:Uncharacterized protein n=1 Tax=Brachypodium distachyon TaxID=15368 RepID=A0A2K2DLU3_BRADI|nr:hypothetical protein BRADI_1g29106v3 [Brachypodium distachyon]PNT75251.1 hypothetical protein BRADI_1g29106v3 [Brachypodium distachyon]PNT75252.1 hypothetical protein BRADI_1g29106v3 [Brachypodium distachyon]